MKDCYLVEEKNECANVTVDKSQIPVLPGDHSIQLELVDLDELKQFAQIRFAQAKENIFHKGDRGVGLFIVLAGRIKLSTFSTKGKEITLALCESGELFGEISVFDTMAQPATATALVPSKLLLVKDRCFLAFLEKHPKTSLKILNTLSRRLRQTYELMEDMLFLNLPSRLAKKLLELASSYGEELSDGKVRICLRFSQTELGNMIAASRESICGQMRMWEKGGFVSYEQGYIIIHHPKKLGCILAGV